MIRKVENKKKKTFDIYKGVTIICNKNKSNISHCHFYSFVSNFKNFISCFELNYSGTKRIKIKL